jgi:hypothetical protein
LPELRAGEPLGGVAVQADHVLPGALRGEGELSLTAVHLNRFSTKRYVFDLVLKNLSCFYSAIETITVYFFMTTPCLGIFNIKLICFSRGPPPHTHTPTYSDR